MMILPGVPPVQQTPRSRELGKRLDEAVRDYHRDHPELTEDEIRAAMVQSTPGGESRDAARRKRAFAVGLSAALIGAFTAVASNGGRWSLAGSWQVVAAAGAACVVVIAAVVLVRRD